MNLHISSLANYGTDKVRGLLSRLTETDAEELLHNWEFLARDDQLPPSGDWRVWLYLAGRGSGKTRSGAEWIRKKVKQGFGRIGCIAPTAADARDVMVEGPSGLLATGWQGDMDPNRNLVGLPSYEPSKRRVTWGNGAMATLFSAEEPDRLRGPQHDALWADELATWQDAEAAWDMAMFGLRVGANPQAMVTTTPRPIPLLRELVRNASADKPSIKTVVTRATSYDNRANLAGAFLSQIIAKYEGTRLGRQEIEGELIEEVEGALWRRAMIRYAAKVPDMKRVVVGVDPAITAKAESALTGIVVAGLGADGKGYVLADYSGRFTPNAWAAKVAWAYERHGASRIIAEGNQGGDLVHSNIHTVNPGLPVKIVHAHTGKMARAEPVAALYEQGKVLHAVSLPELEDQMCTWEPLGDLPSPDRLDAFVWALLALMVEGFGTVRSGTLIGGH